MLHCVIEFIFATFQECWDEAVEKIEMNPGIWGFRFEIEDSVRRSVE